MEGKRHIETVPVKLSRAHNDLRRQHVDSHFAAATIRQLLYVAVLLGEKTTFVLSQDDKARVPLGLAAANKQSPILMNVHYRVSLPDHDWVVASRQNWYHRFMPLLVLAKKRSAVLVQRSSP
jgi:hypothetical protein